ncbi:MAG: terpene cyclase/mutase family protein [Phycisphaeraceae bacterium]|nr:terpene cyclase/mutase family protein [Phycisphaeraceae bacterium]
MKFLSTILVALMMLVISSPLLAVDDAHFKQGDEAIKKAIAYLRATQGADGSWTPKAGPGITALVVRGMLDQPDIKADDPAVKKAVAYILSMVKEDGGIHDGKLENYNTAICLSALARINDQPGVAEIIKKAQDYLRGLQWSDQVDPNGVKITEAHPFYGGAGYGREGRPDMSNTQIMLEGLYDSGLDCNDPAFKRALVFITRCQGTAVNKEFGDKIAPDGGFIYATSQSRDKVGQLESKAGMETVDIPGQGQQNRMRTYGSMTYAGFKSYLYAQLDRNDPRVKDALGWITRHYTLDFNPGLQDKSDTPVDERLQGHYYYFLTFSRAFDAWGQKQITLADGTKRDWGNDLVDKLASLQKEDGSWVNSADRWMEGDPNLTTAFAVLALEHALKK